MPVKDFQVFGTAGGANVASQAAWVALAQRLSGFTANTTADSPECNKAWRQATFPGATLMSWITDQTGLDTLDDGDIAGAQVKLVAALLMLGGVESTVAAPTTVNAASNRTAFVNTAAVTYTIAQTTTMDKSWRLTIQALGGNATLAINAADKINGGSVGAGMVIPQGTMALITTDAAGILYVALTSNNGAVTTITGVTTLTAGQAGLVLVDTSSGNYNITIPDGSGFKGLEFLFVKVSSDVNTATLIPTGSDIFAGVTGNLVLSLQWTNIDLKSDGASPNASYYQTDSIQKRGTVMTAETGLANAVLAGLTNAYLGANVKHDGTNFNRQNVAVAAAALQLTNAGILQLLTAASGSNPIASWIAKNVITESGGTMSGILNLFTGSTVPTAVKNDNSTKIASTGFVKLAGLTASGAIPISSNTALTASQVGNVIEMLSGNITLPLLSSVVNNGDAFLIVNAGSVGTISAAGSDTITPGASPISLRIKDWVLLVKGNGTWLTFSTNQYALEGEITGTNAATGFFKLPNGLIVQWFSATIVRNSAGTYTLPFTFPNAGFEILMTCKDTSLPTSLTSSQAASVGTSTYAAQYNSSQSSDSDFFFLAIGD